MFVVVYSEVSNGASDKVAADVRRRNKPRTFPDKNPPPYVGGYTFPRLCHWPCPFTPALSPKERENILAAQPNITVYTQRQKSRQSSPHPGPLPIGWGEHFGSATKYHRLYTTSEVSANFP